MQYFVKLVHENFIMLLLIGISDILFSFLLAWHFCLSKSKRVMDALGTRYSGMSLYRRCSTLVSQGLSACGRRIGSKNAFTKARLKMRKAGYTGEHAVMIYLSIRYFVSPVVFITAFIMNFPGLLRPLAAVLLINTCMEAVIASDRRKISLRFQKVIYKVYKYLHNQISSGVKPSDAVRTAYEVVEDRELRGVLVRLAARYELTLDIDASLEEFRSSFDVHEAETLCIALKQGIETGDNKRLLERQEDIMFKKYFNYIQAETDSCRNRSILAASVFVAIIAVMIIVPLLGDVGQAVGNIFIY